MENEFITLEKYPKYSINILGEVRFNKTNRIKKATSDGRYLILHLMKGNKSVNAYVHRLMAMTFIPNPENLNYVNHKNGIKTDNSINNLEWCTPKENITHCMEVLNKKRGGSNNSNAKLDEVKVVEIKNLIKEGQVKLSDIGRMYGVKHEVISKIKFGRTWKHIEI